MPRKDLHEQPFDEATLAKLEIFQEYAMAWIPVFVEAGSKTIYIADFFAGTGYDKQGNPGSPIRILDAVKEYKANIVRKNTRMCLMLNEYDTAKCSLLESALEQYFDENPDMRKFLDIKILNLDFEKCFHKCYAQIRKHPSLLYFDQNGIKFLTKEYLTSLDALEKTDFLYFISSSYLWRFGDEPQFKKYIPFDLQKAKEEPYKFIHRNLIQALYEMLPTNSTLRLYPFSIKKGANIYGIVFGTKHLLAVEKFLGIGWKKNSVNGDANFDIDSDHLKKQLDLFESRQPTKIEAFDEDLKKLIKTKGIVTNEELLQFTLEKGHPVTHASKRVRELKASAKVSFPGRGPKINTRSVRDGELVKIRWISE